MPGGTVQSAMRTFFAFLVPRLLLAMVFTASGYLGSGGDPEIYRVLGGFFSDVIRDPESASLAVRMESHGMREVGYTYTRLVIVVQRFAAGELESILGDTGLSIILVHGFLYSLWDHPLFVVLVQCLLNALAYTLIVRRNGIPDAQRALAWNPASLYFCATHFKESFTESAILILLAGSRDKTWILKVLAFLFLGFLRLEYLLFVAIVYAVFLIPRIRNMSWPFLAFATLLLFLVSPAFYADWMVSADGAGIVYSLVYANEVTRRLLGPMLGAILPIPFVLLPLNNMWGIFYTVYGLSYYSTWFGIIRACRKKGSFRGNAYLNAALLVLLLISYRFTGQSGTKDRYFAPFFPLMIIGLTLLRRDDERLFVHGVSEKIGRDGAKNIDGLQAITEG